MKAPNLVFSILLWILSIIGVALSAIVGFTWGFIRILFISYKYNQNPFKLLSNLFWKSSIANDQTMGVQAQYFMNDVFLKPGTSKRFGDSENETMSHVFGWGESEQKLYQAGEGVKDILNKVDKDHTKKAKDNPQ